MICPNYGSPIQLVPLPGRIKTVLLHTCTLAVGPTIWVGSGGDDIRKSAPLLTKRDASITFDDECSAISQAASCIKGVEGEITR
jgi:hypothetical protein